jgi:hypothetical protein
MNVNGYEINESNCSFKQEQQLIICFVGERKNNELFPVHYYMDNQTGRCSLIENEIAERPNRGIYASNYYTTDTRIDIQYDKVSKCLVFFLVAVEIEKHKIKEGDINLYKEINRFYVTKNKNIICKDNKTNEWKFIEKLTKISDLPFNPNEYRMLNERTKEKNGFEILLDTISNVFNKVVVTAGNKTIALTCMENVMEFLMYKEPKPRKGPLQNKIDEYCSVKLPPFVPTKKELKNHLYANEGRLIRIKDDVLCIQMFSVMNDRKTYYEVYRMFVTTDGTTLTCKKNNFNQFVATTSALGGSHWRFSIDNYDEESVKNTKLAYYKDIINHIPDLLRGYAVWCFINYPIFEKLYKMGMSKTLNKIFNQGVDNPISLIEHHFDLNKDSLKSNGNIYSMIGLNKYQLNKYLEAIKNDKLLDMGFYRIFRSLREILNEQYADISSVDNETFDIIFDILQEGIIKNNNLEDALIKASNVYSAKTIINNIDTFKMLYIKDNNDRFGCYHRYFIDYMHMVKQMEATSLYKIKFASIEDVKTAHDNVTCLYNLKKNYYKIKEFEKATERVKKYAFKDDNYEIVIPSSPDDLVKEGNELRHCVRSYIDRVISGSTNILFLRKAQELDVPFFTIELSNSGTIEQIHGFANRNASTEPDMLYFIKNWSKKFKLHSENFNKIR